MGTTTANTINGGGLYAGSQTTTILKDGALVVDNSVIPASSLGDNIYPAAGSTVYYQSPAPNGYWLPNSECVVMRTACTESDGSGCKAAVAPCLVEPDPDGTNVPATVPQSSVRRPCLCASPVPS